MVGGRRPEVELEKGLEGIELVAWELGGKGSGGGGIYEESQVAKREGGDVGG